MGPSQATVHTLHTLLAMQGLDTEKQRLQNNFDNEVSQVRSPILLMRISRTSGGKSHIGGRVRERPWVWA